MQIRFDPEKTFELQAKHDLGGDIRMDSICSKLALVSVLLLLCLFLYESNHLQLCFYY